MKNLRLELFNFKKNLSYENSDIINIIDTHYNACSSASEKQIVTSLNETLKVYAYDTDVKNLLESLNTDMKEYQFLYELKHLYNVLNKQNHGELYRLPINILLDTINLSSDQDRLSKVLNELAVHDWIPEIKMFVLNLTKSPEQRNNLLSGGKSSPVYTIVENVESGIICLIKDSWFLLTENNIEKTLLETHITDTEKLRTLRNLQTAMQYAVLTEDKITFKIPGGLNIGLSTDKKGVLYINDDEMKETTLESLFQSPIISIINKNFYPLLKETAQNVDKFMELDSVVRRVTNLINPYLEVYAFNYKNCNYVYRCDERYGHNFYTYGSVLEIINEIRNDLNYDLTFFYENKLNKEVIIKRKLEDKEREITLKIEDVKYNISKLERSIKAEGANEILTTALTNLNKRKDFLIKEHTAIKEAQYNERVKI